MFLVICMIRMVPALFVLAYPDHLPSHTESIYGIALISSFMLGFFVMSAFAMVGLVVLATVILLRESPMMLAERKR